ncbi:MAG: hypothetical protein WBV11_14525 [Salegentibacter sp.]
MRRKKQRLQSLAIFLVVLILLQSCNIYYNQTASVNEAVKANAKVKLLDKNGEKYKLKRLHKQDEQLYGYARRNSATAKKLYDRIIEEGSNSKIVKLLIPEENIEEIHLRNSELSTAVTIGMGLVILMGAISVAAGLTVDNSGISLWN